ncbi:Fic family protein [bacterium AH-315-K20]|nr:Fic family protein [bacterium AH-315-K20]
MDLSNFTQSSPGKLVQTSGSEPVVKEGRPTLGLFSGQAFLPDPLPPKSLGVDLLGTVYPDLEDAVQNLTRLDGIAASLPSSQLLANPFRIKEAQASSRIENTIASAEDVALDEAGLATTDDSREVGNYLRALDAGLKSQAPLGQWLIKSMHSVLMSGGVRGAEKRPGEYRDGQAYIQGRRRGFADAAFVPPPAEEVQHCMDHLDHFMRSPPAWAPAIVAAALVHYQFECIHPFADGNGRLGRMLIVMMLCRSGLISRPLVYVSPYFDKHQEDYFILLRRVSTEGAWIEWVRFFCIGVATQARDGVYRAKRMLELRQQFADTVTRERASARLRELTDFLFERPAVRSTDVARRLGVRPQQAQRYIDRLTEYGILREITGRNYARVYIAQDVIRVIEAEQPEDTQQT